MLFLECLLILLLSEDLYFSRPMSLTTSKTVG